MIGLDIIRMVTNTNGILGEEPRMQTYHKRKQPPSWRFGIPEAFYSSSLIIMLNWHHSLQLPRGLGDAISRSETIRRSYPRAGSPDGS